jgi:hypothetical protein
MFGSQVGDRERLIDLGLRPGLGGEPQPLGRTRRSCVRLYPPKLLLTSRIRPHQSV